MFSVSYFFSNPQAPRTGRERQFKMELRTGFDQPKLTDLCLGRNGGRRGAAVRKIFNGCAECEEIYGPGRLKPDRWRDNGNITSDRINLALREHRDGAMMVSLAGVLVNQFMQIGAGRHRVEQQNHPHQPGGQGRPAEPNEMTRFVLQTVCNIANDVPLASLILRIAGSGACTRKDKPCLRSACRKQHGAPCSAGLRHRRQHYTRLRRNKNSEASPPKASVAGSGTGVTEKSSTMNSLSL